MKLILAAPHFTSSVSSLRNLPNRDPAPSEFPQAAVGVHFYELRALADSVLWLKANTCCPRFLGKIQKTQSAHFYQSFDQVRPPRLRLLPVCGLTGTCCRRTSTATAARSRSWSAPPTIWGHWCSTTLPVSCPTGEYTEVPVSKGRKDQGDHSGVNHVSSKATPSALLFFSAMGLATLEVMQAMHRTWSNSKVRVNGKTRQMQWRDMFDIAVKWRRWGIFISKQLDALI